MERNAQHRDALQEEGDAMRSTFERIDFLVSQGFICEQDATRKKRDVMDSFCLAPMVDRHRRAQEENGAAVSGGGPGMGFVGSAFGRAMPMAWLPMTASRSMDADRPNPCRSHEERTQRDTSNFHHDQGEYHRGPHRVVHMRETAVDVERSYECEEGKCHLAACFGYEGGRARLCSRHREEGMVQLNHRSSVRGIAPLRSCSPIPSRNTAPRPSHMSNVADHCTSPIVNDVMGPIMSRVESPTRSRATSSRESETVDPEPPERCQVAGETEPLSISPVGRSAESPAVSCTHTGVLGDTHPTSPDPATNAVEHYTLETLGVEAEPTPPTVPDAAEQKGETCEWPKCTKEPHYASRGERARTCFTHKQDGWVPVNRRRCHMEGCMRGASFSLMGSSAIFCGSHRSSDMVDVVNLRRYSCHTEGCDRQAYYNYPGPNRTASKAKYCSTHKLPDMRNVRHRLCQAEGCGTTPTYSFPGDRPRYCAAHKESGMMDTKSKMCAYVERDGNNCSRCRLYGAPGGKATYCLEHKEEGMVNIRQARKRQRM